MNATPLEEGVDYYLEGGLMVFTARYLLKRGYCCQSGCRHCPYGFVNEAEKRAPTNDCCNELNDELSTG